VNSTSIKTSWALIAAMLLSLLGLSPSYAGSQVSELEANKVLIRHYVESRWDSSRMATNDEIFASDVNWQRSEFQNLVTNAEDPMLKMHSDSLSVAIPDRVDVVEEMVAEGNIVGVQYRTTGTHLGNLYGILATGKAIDIQATAFYKLVGGQIIEFWEMSDETGLLQQLGVWLPERSDGMSIAPVANYPVRPGSEVLVDILSEPEDTDTYTNKVRVSAYKSTIRPANQVFDGRPYEIYTRAGFKYVGLRGAELGLTGMNTAFPDRLDQVGVLIAEGNKVMISFLLTGTNTGSLFGNPATNNPVGAWEVGIHTFEGTHWKEGWWFGDDVGMMLQTEVPGEFVIPELR